VSYAGRSWIAVDNTTKKHYRRPAAEAVSAREQELFGQSMTLHLVKLCVGAASIEELATWQSQHRTRHIARLKQRCAWHTTGQKPKRDAQLLDGGSLYWVIKGSILVRQRVLGFEAAQKDNGKSACRLLLDPELVAVRPQPRRAFQGWRYLDADDAPQDLLTNADPGVLAMPPHLRQALADLCLI
jgi:hypothetical protein